MSNPSFPSPFINPNLLLLVAVLDLLTSNCANNGGRVEVSKLDWLEFVGGKEYDLVTGTDVLFREDLVVPLLR